MLLIALACVDVVLRGAAPAASYAVLAGAIGILLLGTGQGALWDPEGAILLRKAGAEPAPSGAERAPA